MDNSTRNFILKLAGARGPMDIMPPLFLGDKGIQSVLKNVSKRKKINKPPFPRPSEVLDRVAGRIADTGFLRNLGKKGELNKQAIIGPGTELRMFGLPSALGYLIGRHNEKNKTLTSHELANNEEEFKSNILKRIAEDKPSNLGRVAKFFMVPGYTGYRLGKGGGRQRALDILARKAQQNNAGQEKQARCWQGFEPVPGKKAYSEGSCRPKTQTTKRVNEKVALEELIDGLAKLSELKKKATSQVTIYFASPSQQLTMIPRDATVSTDENLAFQMGRFYPKTKERWSESDVTGKWNGGTPPTWKAGRIPTGTPRLYRATVSTADLANVSNMVKDIKKLKRGVMAEPVKNKNEES